MNNSENKKKTRKGPIIAILILLIVVIGGLWILDNKKGQEDMSDDPYGYGYTDENLLIDPAVDKALSDYRMIEIIGIDKGGRSDVIFVVAFNEKTSEAKLFTVYRDTLMKINPDGSPYSVQGQEFVYYKCNRSYKADGMLGTMRMLNSHLDLNIREMIGLNWDGVATLIDSIGGVECDITPNIIGRINNGLDSKNKIKKTGKVNLNGTQAVSYLRLRKDTNAAVRAKRNQDVLVKVFQKFKSMDKESQIKAYNNVAGLFKTNIREKSLLELIGKLPEIKVSTYDGFPQNYSILWDQWYSYYYFVAHDLKSNVISMHEKVFGQSGYQVSAGVEKLNDELNDYIKSMKKQ